MLHRYRRYWILVTAALLALPLVAGIVAPADRTVSPNEARVLAPVPAFPLTLAGWRRAPGEMDAYLRDHFGLRQSFLRAYGLIMNRALKNAGNPLVLSGSDGWMFYRGDGMVQQSAGLSRRDAQVAEMADLLATMRTALAAGGSRLVVAPPPNSSTIYADELPLWARNRGQRTEYDVFLKDLADRGIFAVDLRPALFEARKHGKVYYKHDTHWTPRGAMAGFNALVHADAHADWVLDPATALGPQRTIVGGDLARMLGVEADVSETDEPLAVPAGKREEFASGMFGPYLATSDRSGPTIMVIGDSFTMDLLAPMLLQHTGRVIWLHHQTCGFEWKWIDEFHPDEVWWMPTERYMICGPGHRPQGLPAQPASGR
jgi:alginate O-acetyltransferase complex protein AlgJ